MERNKFSMYWAYYKSIENKLIATNQYVTHTKDNELCYSDEFISIILLSCSEIDSILKELLRNMKIPSKKKYYQMSDYASVLKELTTKGVETGNLRNAVTILAAHFLIIRLLIQFIPAEQGQEYLYKETWSNYWIPAV